MWEGPDRRFGQADRLPPKVLTQPQACRHCFLNLHSILKNMFKKKSRAPAVKISVMENLFEKGVNKILLQKFVF